MNKKNTPWRIKLVRAKSSAYVENKINAFMRADGIATYKEPKFVMQGEYILATLFYQPVSR